METTRLSSKGQIVIPKTVRKARGWKEGTEFLVEETSVGVLLRPKSTFEPTTVDDAFGYLKYDGPPRTIEEMNKSILDEAKRRWRRKTGK